ncbi:hypothetical protein NDU88_005914 [Pleurodeles waltl]|uniref:Uncharacterized protein n=1 Tax=Pleurodeles waltl TaxID=8319 RepID=A0AAV7L687_PLEWA|nr:hypothetical protein NDU88_005914 [Pleurodeles waltl]
MPRPRPSREPLSGRAPAGAHSSPRASSPAPSRRARAARHTPQSLPAPRLRHPGQPGHCTTEKGNSSDKARVHSAANQHFESLTVALDWRREPAELQS